MPALAMAMEKIFASDIHAFERQDGLMPAYFLGEDSERSASLERRISEVVPGLINIGKIEDVYHHGKRSMSELSYVLLVGSPDNENSVDSLVAIAEQTRDRIFFILISEEISATN